MVFSQLEMNLLTSKPLFFGCDFSAGPANQQIYYSHHSANGVLRSEEYVLYIDTSLLSGADPSSVKADGKTFLMGIGQVSDSMFWLGLPEGHRDSLRCIVNSLFASLRYTLMQPLANTGSFC